MKRNIAAPDLSILKESQIFFSEKESPYFFTHDYCLVMYGIKTRDLCGRDLALFDWYRESVDKSYYYDLNFIWGYLDYFKVSYPPFYEIGEGKNPIDGLSLEALIDMFDVHINRVFRTPMSRDTWLESVYYMTGGNYTTISEFEDIPMTEFLQMVKIHNEYQAERKKKDT